MGLPSLAIAHEPQIRHICIAQELSSRVPDTQGDRIVAFTFGLLGWVFFLFVFGIFFWF